MMKMNKIKFVILLIVSIFIITGCDKEKDNLTYCEQYGHSIVEATCQEPRHCINCTYQEGAVSSHDYQLWYRTEATCTTDGTEVKKCSVCENLQSETIQHIGHVLGDFVEVNAATYESSGLEKATCQNCEYFEQRVIDQLDATPIVDEAINQISLPKSTLTDIVLPTKQGNVDISWKTSDAEVLSATGKVGKRIATNQKIKLQATFSYGGVVKTKIYEVTVLGYTNEEKLEIVMNSIELPEELNYNLVLQTSFIYGVVAEYSSSHPDYLTNDGIINPQSEDVEVELTVTLILGSDSINKKFTITVLKYVEAQKSHQLLDYAKDYDLSSSSDLKLEDNRLVLADGVTSATYTSNEIETVGFVSAVGSWAAISSENATCELKVSVKVGNTWSDYITYGKWGLGLQNASNNQSNSLIKLSVDEIIVLNNKAATAIKYQITLSRTSTSVESPALLLVSFALEINGYSYYVNTSGLPDYVCYDVPKLYQQVVPEIGNSICSATSTTMLLKYMGLSFTDKDSEYEHRYIAGIVRDYGNKIYGNWVHNTAAMGGYGFEAYVARMYSVDELRYHLANVGPVALTVKGTMTSTEKSYYTNGHLIVAIGYKYINDTLYIICNDPNVKNVYCEYSLSVINNTWRKVAYIIK